MDKKLMLAVAGAGKTTYIINKVCTEYRKVLVITYTDANYNNIISKLREQNDGVIPDGIIVYKYLHSFIDFAINHFFRIKLELKGLITNQIKTDMLSHPIWNIISIQVIGYIVTELHCY